MKNVILTAVIALVYASAMAHNPLTAKFELNANQHQGAILHIYLSQAGLHQALIQYFEQTDFDTISANAYKKLAVQYIKNHIAIHADHVLLHIGKGGIKIGSHQTDLKFLIENYPGDVHELEVHISAFHENDNHHSVFWWKTKDEKSKVVLSIKNDFRATMHLTGHVTMGAANSSKDNFWLPLGASMMLFVLFVIKMMHLKRRKSISMASREKF